MFSEDLKEKVRRTIEFSLFAARSSGRERYAELALKDLAEMLFELDERVGDLDNPEEKT